MLIVCCNLLSEMLLLLPLILLYFSRLFHHSYTFFLILLNIWLTNTLCTFLCQFLLHFHLRIYYFLSYLYWTIFGGKTCTVLALCQKSRITTTFTLLHNLTVTVWPEMMDTLKIFCSQAIFTLICLYFCHISYCISSCYSLTVLFSGWLSILHF